MPICSIVASESTSTSTIDGDSRDSVDERLVKEEVAGIAGSASAAITNNRRRGFSDGVVPEPLLRSRP